MKMLCYWFWLRFKMEIITFYVASVWVEITMLAPRQEAAHHGSPILLESVNQGGLTLAGRGLDPGFRSSFSPIV